MRASTLTSSHLTRPALDTDRSEVLNSESSLLYFIQYTFSIYRRSCSRQPLFDFSFLRWFLQTSLGLKLGDVFVEERRREAMKSVRRQARLATLLNSTDTRKIHDGIELLICDADR